MKRKNYKTEGNLKIRI